MRKLFSRQLVEARHEMLSIYEAVDLALHDAVKAYVTDDRKLASKTKKRTLSIDARCANLEAVCYNLIATQSPVASDFRLLQTIIYVDFNLQRMTDKVRQICRATRHMIKADISLPKELVGTVEAEAEAVYQVLGSSLSALVTNDMSIICNLAVEDEPVHAAYEKFFEDFGRGLEYGIYTSYGMLKDELADLLLFYSAKEQKMVTLAEYLEAMPADQKSIYYAAGDSIDRLAKLPIVNTVLGKGYDVLLCTKDVDEFCFQAMMTYGPEAEQDAEGKDIEGTGPKELKNVASGDLDFASEEEKKEAEEAEKDNEALLAAMKEQLGDAVTKVAVSTRLTDAPSAVTTEGPVSLEMERLMSQMPEGMGEVKSQRVLELNAKHPVFEVLKGAQEAGDADKVNLYTDILYNQALIVEGMPIADPVAYANAVTKLMA